MLQIVILLIISNYWFNRLICHHLMQDLFFYIQPIFVIYINFAKTKTCHSQGSIKKKVNSKRKVSTLWPRATAYGKSTLPAHNKHLLKEDNSKFNSSSTTSLSRPLSSPSKPNSITPTSMKKEMFVLIWLKQVMKNGHQLKNSPKSWKKSSQWWLSPIWTPL